MQPLSPENPRMRPPSLPTQTALLIQAIALLIVLAWWAARGVSYSLDAPAGLPAEAVSHAPQMLPCVSYSPFRHQDINPFNPQARVTPAQIEADLRILKTRTNCIRTYGLSQGLDAVPGVVQKLEMRMKLGVWLARDEVQNRQELARGIALAHQFKDVIDLLVVGNEVLLRRELSPEALGRILAEAKQISPVPVSYADVWEFWLRHAPLAQHVNVVTVHILPYWEDNPVAVHDAVKHVDTIASGVQQHFAVTPVWVGETGWPAAGRQRAGAVPGKIEQNRFVNELLARKSLLDYNLIEGFDQPWKRSFEGAMGGYWGLFDQFGHPRVAFSGNVTEDEQWWRGPVGAVVGGLLALSSLAAVRVRTWSWVLAGALLGALAPLQWLMMQQWDRSPREQALSALLGATSAAVTLITLLPKRNEFARMARDFLLFAASTAALVLLLDARYRPFPWWWFLAPTATILAWRVGDADSVNAFKTSDEARLLAAVLAICAGLVALTEGGRNFQALSYCCLLIVLAGAAGWPRGVFRIKTNRANSAAGAQSSVV